VLRFVRLNHDWIGIRNLCDKTMVIFVNHLWLQDNQTALHVASRVGDVDAVELLISRGASMNAVTSDGYTPLHIAAKEGHDDVAQLLLDRGVPNTPSTKASLLFTA